MASPASILSNNLRNLRGFSFRTSTPRPLLPSDFLVQKLCTLSIRSRKEQAYTKHALSAAVHVYDAKEDKNVQQEAIVNSAELQKHALSAAVHIFDAKEDKNVQQEAIVNSAEHQKHALSAAVHVFDAKEDKNVQQEAKSSCLNMSKMERNPKRLSSSASGRIQLDSFQVLKYPIVTELALQEMLQNNTLIFVVDKHTDKKNIKAAIKRISGVHRLQTKKVNTLVMPNGNKKAYITLRPNFSALDVAKRLGIIEK